MKHLFDLVSTYWVPQKNKRKGSTSTIAERENSEDSQEQQESQEPEEPEDAPIEQDPYHNPDLAESLGVAVVALPVEVCRDSQVPPDSMVPGDDGPVDQVPDPVVAAPKPMPVDSVEVVDSYSPSISPTEIEVTPPEPVPASDHGVDLSQPAPVPEVSPELNKGKDLEKVRQRIEQLRHLYHIQSRFLI